jgi:hypothetical protein
MTTPEQFNQAVSSILALYSRFLEIPEQEIGTKIMQFNNQLDNQIQKFNEESLQLGQNDQTSN